MTNQTADKRVSLNRKRASGGSSMRRPDVVFTICSDITFALIDGMPFHGCRAGFRTVVEVGFKLWMDGFFDTLVQLIEVFFQPLHHRFNGFPSVLQTVFDRFAKLVTDFPARHR